MDNLKAAFITYGKCARFATEALIKNWSLLLGSVALVVTRNIAAIFLGSFGGMLGGFLLGIVQLFILTYYYSWISQTISRSKITIKNLFDLDTNLFFVLVSVSFAFFVINLILTQLTNTMPNQAIILAGVNLLFVILLNALPEVIYQQRSEGTHAFSEALNFIKENWPEWFLPFVVCVIPIFLQAGWAITIFLASLNPLVPPQAMLLILSYWFGGMNYYILLPLLVILVNWYMLFRGQLFKELITGSRRQRAFRLSSN